LKPVCGLEPRDYENIASFCKQRYREYQIIFGVQDSHDSSLAIIQQLMQAFPAVDIQVTVTDQILGANLKVSNLANAAALANYPLLVLADSDIRVEPDYLQRIVQPLQNPAVGVVTCLYRSVAEGWVAAFEALSLSTEFLPSVLAARQTEGMSFALGATIVIRASVLQEIGGFAAVADYLGDDYRLGYLPAQTGHQVVLSDYVVSHVMRTASLAEFVQHQTRWIRNARFARPLGYLGLIFTQGIAASLLVLLLTGGSGLGWAVVGVTGFCRLAMAWIVGVIYLQDPVAAKFFWLIPLRDLVSFGLWCYGFLGNKVEWRGRWFRLEKAGRLVPLS
jgi:ceramide glucosyltransferase